MIAEENQVDTAILEAMAATTLSVRLALVGLILALAEHGSLAPERLFEFYRMLAAAAESRPGASSMAKGAANMLRELEALARGMTNIPPGAGHA